MQLWILQGLLRSTYPLPVLTSNQISCSTRTYYPREAEYRERYTYTCIRVGIAPTKEISIPSMRNFQLPFTVQAFEPENGIKCFLVFCRAGNKAQKFGNHFMQTQFRSCFRLHLWSFAFKQALEKKRRVVPTVYSSHEYGIKCILNSTKQLIFQKMSDDQGNKSNIHQRLCILKCGQ